MTVIKIYGASDDIVEIDGDIEGADEYDTSGNWAGVLEAPTGDTAIVYVDLRKNGTWTATLGQYEEEYVLPDWSVTLTTDFKECRYSTILTLNVPEGTKLTPLKKG